MQLIINSLVIDPATISPPMTQNIIALGLDSGYQANRSFMEGDHWQGGAGWIGPIPRPGEEGAQKTMDEISRAFTSKNVIAEVLERHRSGVLGREPGWTVVPTRPMKAGEPLTPAEETTIQEINALLTEWWDRRNAHGILTAVIEHVLYSRRGVIRLYVPPSRLTIGPNGTSTASAATPLDAALMIYPEAPLPEEATVYTDPDSKQQVSFMAFRRNNQIHLETAFLEDTPATPASEAPVSGVLAPPTTIRTIGGDGKDASVNVALGGRLTMWEVNRKPLITEQIRQAQRALNLALSMVPRNVVTGGFLERILTNAQLPGEWTTDDEGIERFKPADYGTGAGTTTFLSGVENEEEATGKTTITTPGVHFRDPVPVTSSVDGKKSHYEDILDEVGQRHVLMGSDATASGYSREQARADFEETLKTTLVLLVPMGRWLLETVLALVEAFTNTPGVWTDNFRVEFRPYVNSGALSSDEIRVLNESVAAGTISRETALQREGIVDVEAELSRIASQDDAKLAIAERQAAVVQILVAAGVPLDVAGQLADMTTEQIALLVTAQAAKDAAAAAAAAAAVAAAAAAPVNPVASNAIKNRIPPTHTAVPPIGAG